jgi:hypothetical protein
MDDWRYADTQHWLLIVANMVAGLDLDGFLQRIEQSEAAGPVLDPTLYALASGKLAKVKRLAEAAKVLRDEFIRQMEEQSGRDSG